MKKRAMHLAIMMAAILLAFLAGVSPAMAADTTEMYRLYNRNSGEHFYTASAGEKSALVAAGWRDEGVGWVAPTHSSTPVYRLYNKHGGAHHYTTSEGEASLLVAAGWRDEGVGWYSDDAKTVAVYRQYNPHARTGAHNFTTSLGEHNNLVAAGWRGEGISWYACAKGYSTSKPAADTSTVSSVANNGGFTDDEVTNKLLELKASYPEGMAWGSGNSYTTVRSYAKDANNTSSAVRYTLTGGGCSAIAYMAQDHVYGSDRVYVIDSTFDWSAIRPGDHIRMEHDTHSVVVLTKSADSITVFEGNYNTSIHWGRTPSRSQVQSSFAYREWVV